MNKTAVLVQAHSNFDYLILLAVKNPDTAFFIHFDAKITIEKSFLTEIEKLDNIHLLPDEKRVTVYWGGSSQLRATLNLLQEAIKLEPIELFHLMSAECMPLISFNEMECQWRDSGKLNYLECKKRTDTEWRLKVNVYYNNTNLTRTFLGRCLNFFHKKIGTAFNLCYWEEDLLWYGSCWFSINRKLVEKIVDSDINRGYFSKFRFKPCGDEHAFQVFIKEFSVRDTTDNNKRYIKFLPGRSSPEYITEVSNTITEELTSSGFWFIRKVRSGDSIKYLNQLY